MADRELPPLRVKLIGDDSSYKTMMDRASKQADELAKHVAKVGRGASGSGKSGFFNAQEQAIFNRMRLEEDASSIVEKLRFRQLQSQERLGKIQEKIAMRAQRDASRAQRASEKAAKSEEQRLFAQMQIQEKIAMRAQRDAAKATKAEEKRTFTQMQLAEKFAKQEERRVFTQMRLQEKAANQAIRAQEKAAALAKREAAKREREIERQNRQRSRGGGYGGLAGRADIYMGMHGIRNIAQGIAGPAQSAMDFQDAGIAMTAYTGSAEKAAAALKDVQEFALMSPYSSKVLIDNAKSMMSYGISSEKTLTMLKQLGNVAGGNAERMHLLSYAMAQVNSMGILQGQELRQLTESGFNPLMVMAKDMTNTEEEATKKFKELKEAMADGKITAEMVGKALQNVTAKGGMFAGLLDKLNNSTRGLTNQFLEYADLIQRNLFAAIQDQIDDFMKSGVAYMKMISDMISQNKELAKSIATWIWRATVAITAILALKVAYAVLAWTMSPIIPLTMGIYRATMLLTRGLVYLRSVLALVSWSFNITWASFLGPIGWAALAVAALTAMFYKGGLIGAMYDLAAGALWATEHTIGFFWNLSHNLGEIFGSIYVNWNNMWSNMFAAMRQTWNNMSGWLADRILDTGWMFGGYSDAELEQAKKIRAEMTTTQNAAMGKGVPTLESMQLRTNLFDLPTLPTPPPYKEITNPIEEKENVDWNAMMGKGKDEEETEDETKPRKSSSSRSADISAVLRGSAEADARARAFFEGRQGTAATMDPRAPKEDQMLKVMINVEKNTRSQVRFETAEIA